MASPNSAFKRLVGALDKLEISFYVGGSVASALHGSPRATMDVDLVADIQPFHINGLCSELEKEFYIDAEMIREALRMGRSFNLIHYASSYKFDVFPAGDDVYAHVQFERVVRKPVSISGEEPFEVPVASAEDTILNKLAWYRAGGGVSERQLHDIRGIVEIQGDRLDREYMRRWAAHLKVDDLLQQAVP